jgi:hypothetical protein
MHNSSDALHGVLVLTKMISASDCLLLQYYLVIYFTVSNATVLLSASPYMLTFKNRTSYV